LAIASSFLHSRVFGETPPPLRDEHNASGVIGKTRVRLVGLNSLGAVRQRSRQIRAVPAVITIMLDGIVGCYVLLMQTVLCIERHGFLLQHVPDKEQAEANRPGGQCDVKGGKIADPDNAEEKQQPKHEVYHREHEQDFSRFGRKPKTDPAYWT
jgi:hypothetical protein